MPNQPTYRLECLECKEDFPSRGRIVLSPQPHLAGQFRFQELLIAACPKCKERHMEWIGVDYFGNPVEQNRISKKNFDYWTTRVVHNKVNPGSQVLHHMVWGSVYDNKCGHYLYKLVPVR